MRPLTEVRVHRIEWDLVRGRTSSIEVWLSNNQGLVHMIKVLRKMDLSTLSLVEKKLITMITSLDLELMSQLQS
jgi:hypothetical protein